MTWLRPPRDGDLAMVTERRRRGQYDRVPVLSQYYVVYEAEDGEPEWGYWKFFGTEITTNASDIDIHYYVTTTRLVGFAAD